MKEIAEKEDLGEVSNNLIQIASHMLNSNDLRLEFYISDVRQSNISFVVKYQISLLEMDIGLIITNY